MPLPATSNATPVATRPTPRAVWWTVAALLVLHVALAWLARQPAPLTGQDDTYYLLLGRALRGLRYVDIFEVGAPAHHQYPPGYPAFLAVWGALVGDRWNLLLVPSIAASATALFLVFDVLRRRWAPLPALACLAALAVNPPLIDLAGQLRPEALFTALSAGSLWAAERSDRDAGLRWPVAAAALAILAALARTLGAALVIALAGFWLMRRRPRLVAAFTAVALVTVGGWLSWSFSAPRQFAGASYAADFVSAPAAEGHDGGARERPPSFVRVLARRVRVNAMSYLGVALPYRMPFPTIPGTPLDNAAGTLLTTVGLALGLLVLVRKWLPAALFLVVYGGVLVVWPWTSGRFLVPLLPLLVPAAVAGWALLASRFGEGARATTVALLAAVLVATGCAGSVSLVTRGLRCERGGSLPHPSCTTEDQASYFAALDYIRRRTPPDAVILTMKPQPLYYYTERLTVNRDVAMRVEPGATIEFLEERGATHVLLGSLQAAELERIPQRLEPHCSRLEVVERFPPRTWLFRVRAEPGDGAPACAALAEHRRLNQGRDFEAEPEW